MSGNRHLHRKCFRTVLVRKCGNFRRREDDERHFIACLDHAVGTIRGAHTPYLSECGVLRRLFLLGSFHNLQLDRRNGSTLSFLCNPQSGLGRKQELFIMKKCQYRGHSVHCRRIVRCGLHNGGRPGSQRDGDDRLYDYLREERTDNDLSREGRRGCDSVRR